MVHRVITKGAMFNLSTPIPLTTPQSRPSSRHTATAGRMFSSLPCMMETANTLVRVTMLPTERSMPPPRMTSACPRATTPRALA